MKRCWLFWILALLGVVPCVAQQIIYSSLKELVAQSGDTVTTLRVEKRTKNQILLMSGADYRIEAPGNAGLSRYLKSRCYAVRVDSLLYVNCKKMRYQSFRFGLWYAPASCVGGRIFYCAQPVGQVASSSTTPDDVVKLGGEVGDAIAASGLVNARVYYELNLETGKSSFVGKAEMMELLNGHPDWQQALEAEESESASVIGKYLLLLKL